MVPGSGNHRATHREYGSEQAELQRLIRKTRNPATTDLRWEKGHFKTGQKARFRIWGLKILRAVLPHLKGRIDQTIHDFNVINTQQKKAAVKHLAPIARHEESFNDLQSRSVVTVEYAKAYLTPGKRHIADPKTWIYPPTLDEEAPWRLPPELFGAREENPSKNPDRDTMIENMKLDYRIVPDEVVVQSKISKEVSAAKQQQQALQDKSDDLDKKDEKELSEREKPIQKFKELFKAEYSDKTDETKAKRPEGEITDQDPSGYHARTTKFHTVPDSGEAGEAHCQGLRSTMEDATLYTTIEVRTREGVQRLIVSGMFDGHGGGGGSGLQAAEFATKNIAKNLQARLEEGFPKKLDDTQIWNALKLAFVDTSNSFRPPETGDEALCGTTANVVLQNPDTGDIWVANAGDSRALLVSGEGKSKQISEDAKPSIPKYKNPVERRGGKIFENRVNKLVAVPRGLGDHFTYGANTPRPKITKYSKPAEGWNGYTLVQACDGVFDVATTDAIGNVVHEMKQRGASHAQIAGEIVSLSYRAGSADNISAIAIPLK